MSLEPESNLQWKAFLYIAGELSQDEASDFERLLLEDQSAREAVAAAVELVQVVGVVGPGIPSTPNLTRRSQRRRVMTWAISGLAAAALILAVLIPSSRSPRQPNSEASSVALTWSGLRNGIDADWSAVVAGSHPTELADPTLTVEVEETIEPANERPLPSWLLSAASNSRVESPQEEN
jgi:hypothetical protein